MSIVRRLWSEDAPFDFEGEFYRYENAFSSVKPVLPGVSPSTSRERRHPLLTSALQRLTSTPFGENRGSR